VTFAGLVTMLAMLVSDLLYAAADPRISFGGPR
jgi:ABC-type dipeptide/oligopeptide/nickel transport system permease component